MLLIPNPKEVRPRSQVSDYGDGDGDVCSKVEARFGHVSTYKRAYQVVLQYNFSLTGIIYFNATAMYHFTACGYKISFDCSIPVVEAQTHFSP
jgi:hypothetical protein